MNGWMRRWKQMNGEMFFRRLRRLMTRKRIVECVAYMVIALTGATIPFSDGMSLHNSHYNLGWPFSSPVTIYGPSSGLSGISMPSIRPLAYSFLFWLCATILSHIWLRRSRKEKGNPLLAIGSSCIVGVYLTGFLIAFYAVPSFLLRLYYHNINDEAYLRITKLSYFLFPYIAVLSLSSFFISFFLMSRTYIKWARAAFLSVPIAVFFLCVTSYFHPGIWLFRAPVFVIASKYNHLAMFAENIWDKKFWRMYREHRERLERVNQQKLTEEADRSNAEMDELNQESLIKIEPPRRE